MFTQSAKLLTRVGSVPVRAGMSEEISTENASSVTRGKLVKHLTALVRTVVSQRPQKEQAHKIKFHKTSSVPEHFSENI